MKVRGIVVKLWLSMLGLVVVVLGLSTLIQAGLLQRIYFDQQSTRIVEGGKQLAAEIDPYGDITELNRQVSALANYSGASVLVVNDRGSVLAWSGPGMGMGRGMGRGRMGIMHGGVPFTAETIKEVLQGNGVVRREHNPYFQLEVIQVGIPVEKNGQVSGAVMIQAPVAPMVNNLLALHHAGFYALILGALAATILALILARNIVGPVLKMNRVAKAMAEGDYGSQVPVQSGDELGMLANSLNKLSARLKQKIDELNRLDSTRREFVASVSHELRTPLTIMQGYTEALIDGMARDKSQRDQYLQNILEETLRLRRLVEDLLNLRRMEIGQVSVSIKKADIREICRRVVARFNGIVEGRGQKLILDVSETELNAMADEDKLEQVLINLVDNALRYTQAGGEVGVRASREGSFIKVMISDRGPGVPEEEQALVWERFYKADRSRSRNLSGSGLGLAIARAIIELHGGEVGVSSTPGKGATFWFKIPVIEQ